MRERSSILWLTLAAGDGRGPGGARPKPAVRNFFRVSHGDESPRTWTIFCYFPKAHCQGARSEVKQPGPELVPI